MPREDRTQCGRVIIIITRQSEEFIHGVIIKYIFKFHQKNACVSASINEYHHESIFVNNVDYCSFFIFRYMYFIINALN